MAQPSFFGGLLLAWRTEQRFAQGEVSDLLTKANFPYDRSTITKFETGDRRPDGEFLGSMQLCFAMTEEEIALWIRAITRDHRKELHRKYQDFLKQRQG